MQLACVTSHSGRNTHALTLEFSVWLSLCYLAEDSISSIAVLPAPLVPASKDPAPVPAAPALGTVRLSLDDDLAAESLSSFPVPAESSSNSILPKTPARRARPSHGRHRHGATHFTCLRRPSLPVLHCRSPYLRRAFPDLEFRTSPKRDVGVMCVWGVKGYGHACTQGTRRWRNCRYV